MMNRGLCSAWVAWSEFCREALDALAAMRRSLSFLKNRELAGAWNKWMELATKAASERDAIRRRFQRAAQSLRNIKLRKGYNSWVEAAAELSGLAEAAQARLASASRRLRFSGQGRAFKAWARKTAERSRIEYLGRAGASLLCGGARRAVRVWIANRAFFRLEPLAASRRKGLHLLRAAESLTRADAVLRSLHHWHATALWCRLRRATKASERMNASKSERLRQAEAEIEKLGVKLQRQEALTRAANTREQRLGQELEGYKLKVKHSEAHKQSTLAMLKAKEKEAMDATQRFESAEARLEAKQVKHKGKEERSVETLRATAEELKATREALRRAEAQVDALTLRCQEAEAECREAHAKHEAANEQVRASSAQARASDDAAADARRLADERVQRAEARAAEAKLLHEEQLAAMEERARELVNAESERSMARAGAESKLEVQAAQMNGELTRLATQLMEARQAAEAAAQRESAATQRGVEMERELSRLTTELSNHHAQAAKERAAALAAVSERADLEAEAARRHVAALESEGVELRGALSRLSSPLNEARATLRQHGLSRSALEPDGSPPPPPHSEAPPRGAPHDETLWEHGFAHGYSQRQQPQDRMRSPLRIAAASPPTRQQSPMKRWAHEYDHLAHDPAAMSSQLPAAYLEGRASSRRASWLPSPQGPGGEWGGGVEAYSNGAPMRDVRGNGEGGYLYGSALPGYEQDLGRHRAAMEYSDAAKALDERLDELRRFVAASPPPRATGAL